MEEQESALRRLLRQALRFLGLSGIGWLLDFTVYTLLSLRFHDLTWVNVISSLVGASFVFVFSTRFVFRDSHRIALWLKYAIYIGYQLVLIWLISKLLALVHLTIVSHTDWPLLISLAPVLSKMLVTPITMTVNFFAMKTVIEKL
ncbi:MAG: GtrA family protein [Oscillospiraceae bacterium]|nr:GtrA family protein [Oscillospiraceae bacterium]